jgi:hypothetical protein
MHSHLLLKSYFSSKITDCFLKLTKLKFQMAPLEQILQSFQKLGRSTTQLRGCRPAKIYQKTVLDEPKAGCKQHVFTKFNRGALPYWNILTNINRVTFQCGMRLIYQMKPRIFG